MQCPTILVSAPLRRFLKSSKPYKTWKEINFFTSLIVQSLAWAVTRVVAEIGDFSCIKFGGAVDVSFVLAVLKENLRITLMELKPILL